jgi:D-alanyl-D-alanine carboxypeptidase
MRIFPPIPTRRAVVAIALMSVAAITTVTGAAPSGAATSPDAKLDAALAKFVEKEGASPGISVVVQRGATPDLHTAGVADVDSGAEIAIDDHVRMASVAKAYSGAAALSLVGPGTLSLDSTIGELLPQQPTAWADVTLGQLLQHTSGVPDFSGSDAFRAALQASPDVAPPPAQLLSYVADEPLEFTSGSKYVYSNSDNIVVGLMVEAVTGTAYEDALATLVYTPLGLTDTSLPAGLPIPTPFVHAYALDPPAPPEDATETFAAGWAWASGGIVATPAEANRFIRGYASGGTTTPDVMKAQFTFRKGHSEPPGPGTNTAGMAIFRYKTRCGTVYGHTGNTAGFTQFVASTRDGTRSTAVTVNAQITPGSDSVRFANLRQIYTLAVCAALDGA